MPANPVYLIALPTKNDPMLGYLTTSFQDHVRLREKFGYKVDDAMWSFYQRIGIVDQDGKYTEHYGDPLWVYYQYRLAKNDRRPKDAIYAEGQAKMREVEARGVDLATGHGEQIWDLNPQLAAKVNELYADAKVSLWAELTPEFTASIPNVAAAAHPVRRPQRLHRPSRHRRDVEPGIDQRRWKHCGHRGAATRPRARSSSPTA